MSSCSQAQYLPPIPLSLSVTPSSKTRQLLIIEESYCGGRSENMNPQARVSGRTHKSLNIFDMCKEYSYAVTFLGKCDCIEIPTLLPLLSSHHLLICHSRAWSKEGVCSDNHHLVKLAASILYRIVNKWQGKKRKETDNFLTQELILLVFFWI